MKSDICLYHLLHTLSLILYLDILILQNMVLQNELAIIAQSIYIMLQFFEFSIILRSFAVYDEDIYAQILILSLSIQIYFVNMMPSFS